MYRNEEVNNLRFINIFIHFEILHSVDVEKGIISCGVLDERACQVLVTLSSEYYAVPACLEGCVNDYLCFALQLCDNQYIKSLIFRKETATPVLYSTVGGNCLLCTHSIILRI